MPETHVETPELALSLLTEVQEVVDSKAINPAWDPG